MASSATVGALKVVLSADSAQFSAGLKEAEGFAQKFGVVLGNVAGIAAAFGAAAVAAAATAAVQMRKVVNEADEMGKAAQKVGVMTQELSALKYTADLAGVGFDSLQTSLIRLTKSMSEVAKGGDNDAVKAFQALGISVQNANGSLKSSVQVMSEVADKFGEFRDGAEKTALAVAIFGKSGADMIPLLNQGAKAIEEANEEARQFGVTISGDLARDSERFNDNLSRMGYALHGVWVAITGEAIPALADFSDEIVTWLKKAELFRTAGEFMKAVIDDVRGAFILIRAEIVGLSYIWESFVNLFTKPISGGAVGMIEELKKGIRAYSDEIANAHARVVELTRSQSALFKPFTHDDVTAAFFGKPNAPRITPSSGGGSTAESEYDAEKERIAGKLQAIREGITEEAQLRLEKYEADRNLVEEAYNAEIIDAQQHNEYMLGLEKQYQDEKAKIRAAAENKALTDTASFFGSAAKITESWGKKSNAVAKALGIAQALISTYVGATKAMETMSSMGPAAGIAAFAAVMAKGLAAVAAITAVNPNGQSGGGRSVGGSGAGGGVAEQALPDQAGRSMYVTLNGDVFNREMVRGFLEKVSEFQRDGGGKVVFA